MSNFLLFVCGLVITLISGMGVLVYTVSLGYKREKNKIKFKTIVKEYPSIEISSIS